MGRLVCLSGLRHKSPRPGRLVGPLATARPSRLDFGVTVRRDGGATDCSERAPRRPRPDNRGMPPLAQPLIVHRDEIARLCREFGVERLEVFGSAADGRFDPARSDFDLIVTFSPRAQDAISRYFFGFVDALERLLGRRVDLMTNQPIRNPYLRRAVDASRRDLYVRSLAEAS